MLQKMVEKQKDENQNNDEKNPGGRVFIFPTMQFNTIGFREDETCFLELLKFYQKKENSLSRLRLATGYLNLQKEF